MTTNTKETLEERVARARAWAKSTQPAFLKQVEAAHASLPKDFVWPTVLCGDVEKAQPTKDTKSE